MIEQYEVTRRQAELLERLAHDIQATEAALAVAKEKFMLASEAMLTGIAPEGTIIDVNVDECLITLEVSDEA